MGFFDKIFKEIKRVGGQIGDEAKRVGQDIGDVADKGAEEYVRLQKDLLNPLDWLGDQINPPTPGGDGGDAGPLPIPDAPIGSGSPGEGSLYQKRKIVKSGRGGTILTGALVPQNVGKRILG